jgi:hypothetical protein
MVAFAWLPLVAAVRLRQLLVQGMAPVARAGPPVTGRDIPIETPK